MAKSTPKPVDRHVGSRVRMRRMMLKMSQENLGDALDLTFQQVQKYEKGANRIGASRLQQIADTLGVTVSFFFEGAPSTPTTATAGVPVMPDPAGFLTTRHGLDIATAFPKIRSDHFRQAIRDLIVAASVVS